VTSFNFPIKVADGIEITSFGTSIGKLYHDENFIYPVGYSATTTYMGDVMICTIEDARFRPDFVVTPTHGWRYRCKGETPDAAWLGYFAKILRVPKGSFERWRVPGNELFGFTSPVFKRITQSLPGVSECARYQPRRFRTPLLELQRQGLLRVDPARRDAGPLTELVIDFRPLIDRFRATFGQDPPPRIKFPALPLAEALGVTVKELPGALRGLRELWGPKVAPIQDKPQ